jgi:hypothetical protein
VPPAADSTSTDTRGPVAFRLTALAVAVVALVVFASGALVSVVLPYGDWDAMAYGTWSRLIANDWPHLHFAAASAVDYHRPFFYVLQGTVWRVFGFHESLGRLLSLAFAVLLGAAIAFIAWRSVTTRYAQLAAAVAVALLITLASFERYINSGLSDIPVAAMLALTAALLYVRRLGGARLPLVGLAACLSLLTKPSALIALLALGASVLVGPRTDLRRRLPAAGALAAGTAVALIYDFVQARYVHMGLRAFMTSGTDGFYAALSAKVRHDVLLDGSWLGADLRLLLSFAIAYSLARLVPRSTHRISVCVALPLALVWSWLGPHLAGASGGLVPGSEGPWQRIAVLVLAASLLFALAAPNDAVASRIELARLLVWIAPILVVWAWYAVYDVRLVSPAWPALVLLMTRALVPAFAGAYARRQALVAVPALALVVLAAFATENMSGLGTSGWQNLRAALGNDAALRGVGLGGDFGAELDAVIPQVHPGDRIVTADSRLEFRYLSQVSWQAPQSCSQLRRPGRTVFVLLESDEERTLYGAKANSGYWERCRTPKLTKIVERPGAFALFVTGTPRADLGGCGASTPTSGLAVEFGRFRTAAAAARLLAQVKGLGFGEALVEQLGCASYRVVEHGVPSEAVGNSIVAEARTAHLRAKLVAAS